MRIAQTKLPAFGFWGAVVLSLANCLAAVPGLGQALAGLPGAALWKFVSLPMALVVLGLLARSWINSLASNRAGMLIYAFNILVAPFGYEAMGLPYGLGLMLALLPVPFYQAMRWLSDAIEPQQNRKQG